MRGVNNEEKNVCTYGLYVVMKWDVAECNRYDDRTKPSLQDMHMIAWQLVTKKTGKDIGFVSAEDFKRMEEEKWQRTS
jgi:hypothetical protein